ncbi:MAG: acyloxyacyl hydrolase [Candidatus Omnitrophica bacterium]|nr:acyloxyacyl hydrolase [Candidatus Omnitrophota bacterium]MDD5553206.1 acyloxyacyl hydrolase [Candidatus Omnitrophota bacterium]
MKKIGNIFFSILILAGSLLSAEALAQEESQKNFEGVEFLTGFGWGKLKLQGDYHVYPLVVDFDFNLKPMIKKLNLSPRPLWQFQIEPFISYVDRPSSDLETGLSFMLKIGVLPQTSRFQPFLIGGAGLIYITEHTYEEAGEFNFIEQAGIGLHYFFTHDTAFTVQGRYRHLSNADTGYPNRGINNQFILTGISKRF